MNAALPAHIVVKQSGSQEVICTLNTRVNLLTDSSESTDTQWLSLLQSCVIGGHWRTTETGCDARDQGGLGVDRMWDLSVCLEVDEGFEVVYGLYTVCVHSLKMFL